MILRRWGVAGLVLAVAALAGCASRPVAEGSMPWTAGRMSVQVSASADKAASHVSADFDLRGDSRSGELRLSTPLGTRLATTRWSDDEVVLDTGQGEVRYADLDSLSREALGENLPLRAFPDWLAGRPWPGAPSVMQPAGFEQLGWVVSLLGYADGRIDAVRVQVPQVTVRVRLERPGS